MASTGWSWTSSPNVFFPGTSAWVSTARTPGASTAADVSIDTIRACGWGLRRVAPHIIPSRRRSLAYSKSPVTLWTPSTRRTDWPMPPWRRMLTLIASCPDHAGLAQVDQLSIVDDGFSLDEEVLHRARVAEDESRHRIRFRAAVGKPVDREKGDVGPLADLDRADVVPAEARRPAAGRHAQRLAGAHRDRKSTRLNSSHITISYAVFCLKK